MTCGMKARVETQELNRRFLDSREPVELDRVNRFPAALPEGPHPIPSRTRKLSPPGPMVLHGRPCGRVGRCRSLLGPPVFIDWGPFSFPELGVGLLLRGGDNAVRAEAVAAEQRLGGGAVEGSGADQVASALVGGQGAAGPRREAAAGGAGEVAAVDERGLELLGQRRRQDELVVLGGERRRGRDLGAAVSL